MKKQYWFIVLTYIIAQLSAGPGGFLLYFQFGIGEHIESTENAILYASFYWLIGSFIVCLGITICLLWHERYQRNELIGKPVSIPISISWIISGVFIALIAQGIAASIEMYIFNIEPGSENTEMITSFIQQIPVLILVTSIIGPILEEIIFRKILFGVIYSKSNFIIAALISSLLFSVVHGDLEHTLIYTAMGFTFAFLYYQTKRIIVPIMAHVLMNTFVVAIQLFYKPLLDEIVSNFISSLF
ncbi:CPBP family intramembrane metalloprotease [Bacillus carboniphilus]|uniref:CPBP family intramembrane metalloprotease n=1 Tax=Bacillus carboniphilus TaxID=86663 RepID=A0ABY9JS42_9BACI|nr:CPBP family intramembrane glutamic endopeptidase [Bacillus carboniphilus]WLR42162.1 CPBP family intramembrane metalloprotease [Bacillus carboniphilus]